MVTASTPDFLRQPDPTPDAAGADAAATGTQGARPDLLDSITEMAHQTVDRLAEQVTPVVQRLHAQVADATGTPNAAADPIRAVADAWLETLRDSVRDHPLAAVATALAVGLLLAGGGRGLFLASSPSQPSRR